MKKHIIIIALVVVGLWFWGWTAGRSYPTFKNYYIPLNTATSSMAQLETDVFNLRRDISALKFVLDYEAEGDKHAWSNRLMEFEKRIDLLEHPAGKLGYTMTGEVATLTLVLNLDLESGPKYPVAGRPTEACHLARAALVAGPNDPLATPTGITRYP